MSTKESFSGSLTFPWWVGLMQGAFSLIIGFLLLSNPLASTAMIVQFVGMYWLISGVFSLVSIFIDESGRGWKLISGVIGVLAGLSIVNHPIWSTFMLPTVMVIFMGVDGLIIGVIGIIGAFKGGGLASGILGALSFFFGLFLLGSPFIGALALPFVYGALAMVGGIAAIIAAFQQNKAEQAAE